MSRLNDDFRDLMIQKTTSAVVERKQDGPPRKKRKYDEVLPSDEKEKKAAIMELLQSSDRSDRFRKKKELAMKRKMEKEEYAAAKKDEEVQILWKKGRKVIISKKQKGLMKIHRADETETSETSYVDRAQLRRLQVDDDFEKHRQMTEKESRYLGGDLEFTHNVKGLDYVLLKKVREEQSKTSAHVPLETVIDDKVEKLLNSPTDSIPMKHSYLLPFTYLGETEVEPKHLLRDIKFIVDVGRVSSVYSDIPEQNLSSKSKKDVKDYLYPEPMDKEMSSLLAESFNWIYENKRELELRPAGKLQRGPHGVLNARKGIATEEEKTIKSDEEDVDMFG